MGDERQDARVLRLYVMGTSPYTHSALACLADIVATCNGQPLDWQVIDLQVDSLRGLQDGVLVTPTLVQYAPGPTKRIVGNLSDRKAVFAALGIGPSRPDSR